MKETFGGLSEQVQRPEQQIAFTPVHQVLQVKHGSSTQTSHPVRELGMLSRGIPQYRKDGGRAVLLAANQEDAAVGINQRPAPAMLFWRDAQR